MPTWMVLYITVWNSVSTFQDIDVLVGSSSVLGITDRHTMLTRSITYLQLLAKHCTLFGFSSLIDFCLVLKRYRDIDKIFTRYRRLCTTKSLCITLYSVDKS
jgi:hypothetical protein